MNQPNRFELDAVSERLSDSEDAMSWLEREQLRRAMLWRARWCTTGGWILLTFASLVASFFAVKLSYDVYRMGQETGISVYGNNPWRLIWLPSVIVACSVVFVVGGILGAIFGWIPGYRSTRSAIDLSAATDAVTRLLSAGCTYPEAYLTASKVVQNPSSRKWLVAAADRVERGVMTAGEMNRSGGDLGMLEALIDPSGQAPSQQWRLASDHFYRVARGRLVLLTHSVPLVTTILAGFLIWIAISSSLAWFWIAVHQLIGGLT